MDLDKIVYYLKRAWRWVFPPEVVVVPLDRVELLKLVEHYSTSDAIKTEVITMPGGNDFIFEDEENQIIMCVENKMIHVSNHGFLFNEHYDSDFTNELKDIINKNLMERRLRRKEEVFNNKVGLLTKINNIYGL